MNPRDALLMKLVTYLGATGTLAKMRLVKEEQGRLGAYLSEGNLWTHTRFHFGYIIMNFFRDELKKENLDEETKEMCKDCINNWIMPANIALQIDESQRKSEVKS